MKGEQLDLKLGGWRMTYGYTCNYTKVLYVQTNEERIRTRIKGADGQKKSDE